VNDSTQSFNLSLSSLQLDIFSAAVGSSTAEDLLNQSTQIVMPSASLMDADIAMDFSGALFSAFNQMFPDPKEICN